MGFTRDHLLASLDSSNGSYRRIPIKRGRPPRPRPYLIHVVLFLLTVVTTTLVGARLTLNFESNQPMFTEEDILTFVRLIEHPELLLSGLPFSLSLIAILLAHEMGHYLTCRYYGVRASLPYFIPAPTFIGTLGAFIRIKSPILSKRVLFDIGVAGPLAGFVVLIPVLAIGLAYSKVFPGGAPQGDIIFGTPGLMRLAEILVFGNVPSSDIYWHPIAYAAWVGMFATALNLLPIGQLDGGHIVYALFGESHWKISRLLLILLIPLGFLYWYGWLVWALLLLLFGTRHPPVADPTELDPYRKRLALWSLIVFIVCFMVVPVELSYPF